MIVTLWRHGQAGSAPSDRLRQLTGTGTDDIGFGCHQLHAACEGRGLPAPGTLLHSPWLRTTQTADIVATAFSHASIQPETALQPGSNIPAVDSVLQGLLDTHGTDQHAVLVCHQPLVSYLIDHYLGESGAVPPLTPGGLATLTMDVPAAACGRLLFWALPPEYEAGT